MSKRTKRRKRAKKITRTPMWKNYEDVARAIVEKFGARFGLASVEEKQEDYGHLSGTQWEIDGKGIYADGTRFAIVESRKTKARQSQEDVAALAFRITDTGAASGLIVTPTPLQRGAQKVADATRIVPVLLREGSTTTEYVVSFLREIHVSVADSVLVNDGVSAIRDEVGMVLRDAETGEILECRGHPELTAKILEDD